MRVLSNGVGLMMAVNDEGFGVEIFRTVAYMVLDELLGLLPMDWEDRLLAKTLGHTRRGPHLGMA